jgi:hypothetical protein
MEQRAQGMGKAGEGARTFARRLKGFIQEAKDRAYNAWGAFEGSTAENILSYRMRIKEAIQAITRLRRGLDPAKGKPGIFTTEIYKGKPPFTSISGRPTLPALDEAKQQLYIPDVFRQDTDIIWRTEEGQVIPDTQRPVVPDPRKGQSVNMQINNFGGVPQAVAPFSRGGNWMNPNPLGLA